MPEEEEISEEVMSEDEEELPVFETQRRFESRHSFSYRIGVNNEYNLKDSLEIDNSLANLLEQKLQDLYKLKKELKDNSNLNIPITDNIKNLFKDLDANGDSRISKIEFWKFYVGVVNLNSDIKSLFENTSEDASEDASEDISGDTSLGISIDLKDINEIQKHLITITINITKAEEDKTAKEKKAEEASKAYEAAKEATKALEVARSELFEATEAATKPLKDAEAAETAKEAEAEAEAAKAVEELEEARKNVEKEKKKFEKLNMYLKLHDNINTFNSLFDVNLFDETKVETETKDKLIKLYGMLDENFDNRLTEEEFINGLKINARATATEEEKKFLEKIIEIFELLVKKISIMIDLANIKSKLQYEYEADDQYDFDTQKNHLKYLYHSLEISEKFLLKLKSKGYQTINLQNDIRLLLDIHHCISIEDERRPIKQMSGCYNAIQKVGAEIDMDKSETSETNVILSAKYDQDMPIDKTNKSGLNSINNLLKLLDELQSFIYIFLKNEINLIHVLKESKLQLLKTKEKLEILKIKFFNLYIKDSQLLIECPQPPPPPSPSPSPTPAGSLEQSREVSLAPSPTPGSLEQSREVSLASSTPGSKVQSSKSTPIKGGRKKKKSMEFKF